MKVMVWSDTDWPGRAADESGDVEWSRSSRRGCG